MEDIQQVEQIFVEITAIYGLKHQQVKAQKLAGHIRHLRHLAWNSLTQEEKLTIRDVLDYDGEEWEYKQLVNNK